MIIKIALLCVSTPSILLEARVLMQRSLLFHNQLHEDDNLWTIERNLPPPSTVTELIFISSFAYVSLRRISSFTVKKEQRASIRNE